VAVCLALRSTIIPGSVFETPILKHLLPSIRLTTKEDDDVRVYVAIDDDDIFWVRRRLILERRNVRILIVKKQTLNGRIPFNEILALAYQERAEYLVRINDDTFFRSANWVQNGKQALANMIPENVGVVAPRLEKAESIFIHDMVHRTHLTIFPTYYPEDFKNWFIDDWITLVYRPNRSKSLIDWTIGHLNVPTRYIIDMIPPDKLNMAVQKGQHRIKDFISKNYF
jgi:hypothetical protein